MKSSETKLEWIEPQMSSHSGTVDAWFTRKNADCVNSRRRIPGLNLGSNTGEDVQTVQQNRSLLLADLDIDSQWIAYAGQVHGNRVQVVSQGGTYPGTDALVTQIPGLALAIQVADCAAVLMADAGNKVTAAVHAGWRGAAGDILPKTIEKMQDLGAEVRQVRAFISPCISIEHFEVGKEVAEQFPDRFVDYENYQKPHVDLKGFLKNQMQKMGMKEEYLEVHRDCTVADERHYYSYRREQDRSGRMMGIIRLNV